MFVDAPTRRYDALSVTQQAWGHGAYVGVTSQAVCQWMGGTWAAAIPQTFDNVLRAGGALFEMATTELWVDIMYQGVDARGE